MIRLECPDCKSTSFSITKIVKVVMHIKNPEGLMSWDEQDVQATSKLVEVMRCKECGRMVEDERVRETLEGFAKAYTYDYE